MVSRASINRIRKIDAHQHFWKYNPRDYGWMTDNMRSLRFDYLPADLAPLLAASGVSATVAVQARGTVDESRWLLQLASENDFIAGVVGWVDLCSRSLRSQLEELVPHRKFRGVRHVVQDEPDDQFMLRDDFIEGIAALKSFDLTYDLLLYPRHLPVAEQLISRFPAQPFVIDHLAKPIVREGKLTPWQQHIRRVARYENVFCKLSGLVTEADWQRWRPSDFTPYLDTVLECFGPGRLMVGSDWPVCTLAASYDKVIELVEDYLSQLSADEQEDIWAGNAIRFYGLQVPGETAQTIPTG